MRVHRTEATVGSDGSVTIGGLPFAEGEAVEVVVLPAAAPRPEHPAERPGRRAGSARGLITVPEDFGDPIALGEALQTDDGPRVDPQDWHEDLGPRVRALLDRPPSRAAPTDENGREHLGRERR